MRQSEVVHKVLNVLEVIEDASVGPLRKSAVTDQCSSPALTMMRFNRLALGQGRQDKY